MPMKDKLSEGGNRASSTMNNTIRTACILAGILVWIVALLTLINSAAFCWWQAAYPHKTQQLNETWSNRAILWSLGTIGWLTTPAIVLGIRSIRSRRR